ncbi:MAG: hypothetical protein CMB89_11315, partial [Flammeovirgaceae bacterium]|nr:hypothetical protein [Flammeovirgaceae bacterium]
ANLILDVSERPDGAVPFDSDDIFLKTFTQLDLKNTKSEVIFRTAACGAARIPEIRTAHLPKRDDSWFASTSEQDKAMRQFLAKSKADLDYLASLPRDQQQTNLYRTLVAIVEESSASTSVKILIIFSDACEYSSVFQSSRYQHDPKRLMTDFEPIVSQLEADTKLPDMTGFSVFLITPGASDLELFMARFWEKLIVSKGGSFQKRAAF